MSDLPISLTSKWAGISLGIVQCWTQKSHHITVGRSKNNIDILFLPQPA